MEPIAGEDAPNTTAISPPGQRLSLFAGGPNRLILFLIQVSNWLRLTVTNDCAFAMRGGETSFGKVVYKHHHVAVVMVTMVMAPAAETYVTLSLGGGRRRLGLDDQSKTTADVSND